ncbi:MAG: hypothetical protein Q9227_000087 [Pyrenula ochraceoflavens]
MEKQRETPTLLSIPLELRQDVYLRLFNKWVPHQRDKYANILYVCHQTHDEGLEILLRDSKHFHTLPALLTWIQRGNPRYLRFVKSISLHAYEESMKELRNGIWNTVSMEEEEAKKTQETLDEAVKKDATAWEETYVDTLLKAGIPWPNSLESVGKPLSKIAKLRRMIKEMLSPPQEAAPSADVRQNPRISIPTLVTALQSLSGLQSIWVNTGGKSGASATSPEAYLPDQQFLLSLLVSCSRETLRELSFPAAGLTPLTFLRSMPQLRLLRFSGYSLSSPEETLEVLRSCPKLREMSIYRYPEFYDKEHNTVTSDLERHVSFTPSVLAGMHPLTVFQISHMSSQVSSHTLTLDMLDAVVGTHADSLRQIRIGADGTISDELARKILETVRDLQKVEIVEIRFKVRFEMSGLGKKELAEFVPVSALKGQMAVYRERHSKDVTVKIEDVRKEREAQFFEEERQT